MMIPQCNIFEVYVIFVVSGSESLAPLASLRLSALTSTFDITDNVDLKNFALGHPHRPTLLPCSKLCLETHKLARWIEGEGVCCLENKSRGTQSKRFPQATALCYLVIWRHLYSWCGKSLHVSLPFYSLASFLYVKIVTIYLIWKCPTLFV